MILPQHADLTVNITQREAIQEQEQLDPYRRFISHLSFGEFSAVHVPRATPTAIKGMRWNFILPGDVIKSRQHSTMTTRLTAAILANKEQNEKSSSCVVLKWVPTSVLTESLNVKRSSGG